jgi:hypothetical protein
VFENGVSSDTNDSGGRDVVVRFEFKNFFNRYLGFCSPPSRLTVNVCSLL